MRNELTELVAVVCDAYEKSQALLIARENVLNAAMAKVNEKDAELKEREAAVERREKAVNEIYGVAAQRKAAIQVLNENMDQLRRQKMEAEQNARDARKELQKVKDALPFIRA